MRGGEIGKKDREGKGMRERRVGRKRGAETKRKQERKGKNNILRMAGDGMTRKEE